MSKMKYLKLFSLIVFLGCGSKDEWTTLFNGENFDGWHVYGGGENWNGWYVENGVLTQDSAIDGGCANVYTNTEALEVHEEMIISPNPSTGYFQLEVPPSFKVDQIKLFNQLE